jgi:hypothetical protein
MLELTLTQLTWRFLLTCFLLVALSFQGMAQASMVACERGHPTESAPDGMQASADHSDHHRHATTAVKAKTFKDKCNHCAPCCTGAAMLTESAIVIALPVVAHDFPALTVAKHSIDRARLDRPPQTFLD